MYGGTTVTLDGCGGNPGSPVNDSLRMGKLGPAVDGIIDVCAICTFSTAGADSGISASDDALLKAGETVGAGLEGGAGSAVILLKYVCVCCNDADLGNDDCGSAGKPVAFVGVGIMCFM